MESFFSATGIPAWDFIHISAIFLLTMLVIFGVKDQKNLWLSYLLLVIFTLQCLFVIGFREGLSVKLFAALMLVSTLLIKAALSGKGIVRSKQRVE